MPTGAGGAEGDDECWFSIGKLGSEHLMSIAASRDAGVASDIDMEIDVIDGSEGIESALEDEMTVDRSGMRVVERIPTDHRASSVT